MTATIAQLEAAFDHELATDTRAAAETAYALAVRYRSEDIAGERHWATATSWAERAIELLERIPSATLSDVASSRSTVGGVSLPSLLHAGVVRARLADLLP